MDLKEYKLKLKKDLKTAIKKNDSFRICAIKKRLQELKYKRNEENYTV